MSNNGVSARPASLDNSNDLKLFSTSPIDYSEENLKSIERVMTEEYGNVRRDIVGPGGQRAYWFISDHNSGRNKFGVFVDVSLEEKDRGIMSVSGSKDYVIKIKDKLEGVLNTKLV